MWILSAFNTGVTLVDSAADIAVTGPDLTADEPQRVASSLLPFAARFQAAPDGFWDMGIAIASQSDHFAPLEQPEPSSIAIDVAGPRSHADLLAAAQPDARRLLLIADPVKTDPTETLQRDIAAIINACLGDGSLVLAAGTAPEQLARLAGQEGAEQAGSID